jgi:transposase
VRRIDEGQPMSRFVEGVDRSQNVLFPERLDDYIGEDNPVRVVDAFVEHLDLIGLGFEGAMPEAGSHGSPRLSPRHLAEDLPVRVSEPGAVEPEVGTRGTAER